MRTFSAICLAIAATLATQAAAIDELFEKSSPNSRNGFLAVEDPAYLRECGTCHFAYSPGMLPARSWSMMMGRLDRHFGESLGLAPDTRTVIGSYLGENAADRSPYSGSKILMEDIADDSTPVRIQSVPRIRMAHRVMREVIARNFRVKVRTLVNCDGCHQQASAGDFSLRELRVEGLSGLQLLRPKTVTER